MSKTRKSRRHLRMESLEDRTLMAGNVAAVLGPVGSLDITGDPASNGVAIYEAGGLVHVVGLPAGGAPTLVNGLPSVTFPGLGYDFNIDMQGGNDKVTMDNVSTGYLNVRLGSGQDVIDITNTQIQGYTGIQGGPQADTLRMADSIIYNNALFAGGGGSDQITLQRNDFSAGNLTVRAGAGHDAIFSQENLYSGLNIDSGGGDDSASLLYDEVANLQIRTRMGNDHVALDWVHVNGPTFIHTGDGDDVVLVNYSDFFGAFNADGGLGANDEFHGVAPAFNNNYFGGSAQINFAIVN